MNGTQRHRIWILTPAILFAALLGAVGLPGVQTAWAATDFQWTWMDGNSAVTERGTYGTMLVPAADNTPGGRGEAVSWIDPSGAFWLFGGSGYDSMGVGDCLNDLWKYDRGTGNWTWMKGSSTVNQSGTYGTLLTPAAGNKPGARAYAVSWTDSSGAFWLFGGRGYDGAGAYGYLNDLWKYDRNTGNWTWMKGASTVNQYGTYGTILTPEDGNTPGARNCAVSWTDPSGALWLFGGGGYDSAGSQGSLNDLWKFNQASGNWVWVKGANTINQSGVYGQRGVLAIDNTPGARASGVSWTDPSGTFWLFGGHVRGSNGIPGRVNDLWKYDRMSGNWTWMKGAMADSQTGTYGTLGTPSVDNSPGGHTFAVAWTDRSGTLGLFGGYGIDAFGNYSYLNDAWRYDRTTGNWMWMNGANEVNHSGTYGALGTPNPANTPGARAGSPSWTDSSGALWLFGGFGYDGSAHFGGLTDLWRWQDAVPPTGTIVINSSRFVTNTPNVKLSLNWSDGVNDGSGVSRMKFSNDAVTWTSWEPLAATKTWTLPAGEGYHTVRAMFRDVAGNNSLVYSDYIRLDTVPPTGSIIINGGAATTTNPTVSLGLTWSDGTGSGVTRMRFSTDGAHWTAWEPQKTPKSYVLPTSTPGYYTVRVQYLDAGNNYSPVYSDYIKLLAP